jgi:hypothetical protein
MSGFLPPVVRQAKTDLALPAAPRQPPSLSRKRAVALTIVLGDHPHAEHPGKLLHHLVKTSQLPILPKAPPVKKAGGTDTSVHSFSWIKPSIDLARSSVTGELHSTKVKAFTAQ